MAQNLKKELARRGYWYRKLKKVLHTQTGEIALIKHKLQLHLNDRQLYFDMGKAQGRNEIQKDRDAFRNKYLDYVRRFNSTKQEYDTIKQEFDTVKRESDAIKQENIAIKQVLEVTKQENIEVKEENEDIKEENEDLKYMLEPMMRRINMLNNQLTESLENNPVESDNSDQESLVNSPAESDKSDQVLENIGTPIAIKKISNKDIYTSTFETEIQTLTNLRMEKPKVEGCKRKKPTKNNNETKRKKL